MYHPEHLNGSSLNSEVPSSSFAGNSLERAGKVVIQLCLVVAVWSREGGGKREAEQQSLYKPSTLTPSSLLHESVGLVKTPCFCKSLFI